MLCEIRGKTKMFPYNNKDINEKKPGHPIKESLAFGLQ